jgi:NitT/TauT family transport system substrate-binding protein
MSPRRISAVVAASACALALVACGGGAAAPASSAPAASAAAPGGSAKPAASAGAAGGSAKPAASASTPASGQAAPGASASGLTKIKLAYSQVSAAATPIYVAADQGFYQKYGLDVDVGMVAGPQQVPAMMSGEIQFGSPGGNEVADADLGGASLVIVAVAANVPLFSLNAEKTITDPQQLAGKSVTITTAGSSTEAAAKIFLDHFGLLGKVKLQPSGQIQAVLAALEQGNAAGAILSPPSTNIATKDGYPELINGPKLGAPMVHATIAVTRDYLKAHADIVKKVLQAYQDGWTFCGNGANEAAVEQTLVKWTKADQQVAKESYDYIFPVWSTVKVPTVDPKAMQNILTIVSANPKAKTADPNQFFDNSILESIAKP